MTLSKNHTLRILCILTLLMVCNFSIHAQIKDSLTNTLQLRIQKTESEAEKIPLLLELAQHVYTYDIDKARMLAINAQEIIENIEDNSPFYKKQKINCYLILAVCDELQDNLSSSFENVKRAVELANNINDSVSLRKSYRIRGALSIKNGDTLQGTKYYKKAIEIAENINDSAGVAESYIYYGNVFFYKKTHNDSLIYYMNLAKTYDNSLKNTINADANIAAYFMFDKNYKKALATYKSLIEPHKKIKNYIGLSSCFMNLGTVYAFLGNKEKAIQSIDSAIAYSKKIGNKDYLVSQYESRRNINYHFEDYKAAINDFDLYKKYYDSTYNIQEAKRFTKLELNYKHEKEKEIAAIELKNEASKKVLYIFLLCISLLTAIITVVFIRKNNKQRLQLAQNELELKEVARLKADLALANREKELKKIVIENSITEEVLNKTLDDIKKIITFENEKERKTALKSLSAKLLSEKSLKSSTTTLQNYLDDVSLDFKVIIDTHFPELKSNEKNILYMMKLGLSTADISKLFNTTLASVKSSRYRIRKKLGLKSDDDIIAFIESVDNTRSS